MDLLFRVVEIFLGLVSFAAVIAFWEHRSTTKRLKKYVSDYITSVEFKWSNQSDNFILMHRVRAFELLLGNVKALQPRTPGAYARVEELRDALLVFHKGIYILNGQHLPLAKCDEFPTAPYYSTEPDVRDKILNELGNVKWLRLDKLLHQAKTSQ